MVLVVSSRLDCRGLFDPVPFVLLRRALAKMRGGEILELISDDPASESDMRAWANLTGHQLLEIYFRGNEVSCYIEKHL